MPGGILEKSGCFMQRQNGPVDAYISAVVVLVVVVMIMTMMIISTPTHFHSCHELWLCFPLLRVDTSNFYVFMLCEI
jgi:hypothetical protein